MQGKLKESENNLLEAISNYENILGYAGTSHYQAALNTLGLVCVDEGRLDEACSLFKKSMNAAEYIYGTEHREYIAARNNLERTKKQIAMKDAASEDNNEGH